MAQYGNTAGGSVSTRDVTHPSVRGIPVTVSGSETGTSISVRLSALSATAQVAGVIYDNSGNLVDSASTTPGTTSDGDWVTVTLNDVSLSAATYYIGVTVDETEIAYYTVGTTGDGWSGFVTASFPSFDDPESISSDDRAFDMYLTTTATGGGGSTLLERQTRGVMRGVMRGAR